MSDFDFKFGDKKIKGELPNDKESREDFIQRSLKAFRTDRGIPESEVPDEDLIKAAGDIYDIGKKVKDDADVMGGLAIVLSDSMWKDFFENATSGKLSGADTALMYVYGKGTGVIGKMIGELQKMKQGDENEEIRDMIIGSIEGMKKFLHEVVQDALKEVEAAMRKDK